MRCVKSFDLYSKWALLHPYAITDVEEAQVPLLVAGDPAYLLLLWLIKGYSGPNVSKEQEAFDRHLNGSEVKVQHAFTTLPWPQLWQRVVYSITSARWRSNHLYHLLKICVMKVSLNDVTCSVMTDLLHTAYSLVASKQPSPQTNEHSFLQH